jgi:hypothetical protein
MTVHPHVAGLFPLADPGWRRKIFVGGLCLMLPLFGWPAILGYRKELVLHLFRDAPRPLPRWKGRFFHYFREGVKSMGVIFGYLAPLYATLLGVVASRGFAPGATTALIALFFVVFPIFSTLSFPTACFLFAFGRDRAWITPGELAAFLAVFSVVIFLIPAGFLRVTVTGRYRSAFHLGRTLPLIRRHFLAYLAAWWYSGLMSLLGHLTIPLAPWGVVWAYLAIIFLFNEIVHRDGKASGAGWLARSLADPRFADRGRFGFDRMPEGAATRARILDFGSFSVPLPAFTEPRPEHR